MHLGSVRRAWSAVLQCTPSISHGATVSDVDEAHDAKQLRNPYTGHTSERMQTKRSRSGKAASKGKSRRENRENLEMRTTGVGCLGKSTRR